MTNGNTPAHHRAQALEAKRKFEEQQEQLKKQSK
jgi:hypothetical protein